MEKTQTSKSDRARLILPVARVSRGRDSTSINRASVNSMVFLTGAVECLMGEIISTSDNECCDNKRKLIQPKDVRSAIAKDDEMNSAFENNVIA